MVPIVTLSPRTELSSEVSVIPINNLKEITGKTHRSGLSSVSSLHQTRLRGDLKIQLYFLSIEIFSVQFDKHLLGSGFTT